MKLIPLKIMSKTKIFLPLGLAIACLAVSGVKRANAQAVCDEMAPIGEPTACKATATVEFMPDPNSATNSQSGPVDASVSASTCPFKNPNILTLGGDVNFSGTGESSVMTGLMVGSLTEAPVEIRNSCQLDVTGTRGIIFGLLPTSVACGGAFQEEVLAIDGMGMPLDLGPLTFVWEIEGVSLKTHTTGIPQIGMSASFSFVASDFSDPNPVNLEQEVKTWTLSHNKDTFGETCTLTLPPGELEPISPPEIGNVTIDGETLPGCEYSIPQILVSIDVEPTQPNGNRYLFGGAAAGFAANSFILDDAFGGTFSARAFVENMNTVSFAAVLLGDGTTPESRGAILNFDSGIMSPNSPISTTVPEPASNLAFIALGILGTASYQIRLNTHNKRRLG